MPVREAQERIDSREFAQWMGFFHYNPPPIYRGDIQAALISSTIANAHRDGKKQKPFKIKDFLLDFKPREKLDKNALKQKVKMLLIQAGFKKVKKK